MGMRDRWWGCCWVMTVEVRNKRGNVRKRKGGMGKEYRSKVGGVSCS
jgi:hypothetical protein